MPEPIDLQRLEMSGSNLEDAELDLTLVGEEQEELAAAASEPHATASYMPQTTMTSLPAVGNSAACKSTTSVTAQTKSEGQHIVARADKGNLRATFKIAKNTSRFPFFFSKIKTD